MPSLTSRNNSFGEQNYNAISRESREQKRNVSLNHLFDQNFDNSLDVAIENINQTNVNSIFNQDSDKPVREEDIQLNLMHSMDNNDEDIPLVTSLSNNDTVDINSLNDKIRSSRPKSLWALFKQVLLKVTTSNNDIKNKRIQLPEYDSEDDETTLSILNQRTIRQHMNVSRFPSNSISNAKYNILTFLPIILYEQFKFFFNLYFLVVALSQLIPLLRIGYLSSYVVPLSFVLLVTMSKELLDDLLRRRRDNDQNNEKYEVIGTTAPVMSKNLKVGDMVKIHKDTRIPADMILLQSNESNGESFIKTDQLDGETDWKLRLATPLTQNLPIDQLSNIIITTNQPSKSIHSFVGKLSIGNNTMGLSVDNTMWANTVLASGSLIGCVIYTGTDTRQAMNTTKSGVKTGLLELEINSLSKILCVCVFVLSVVLVACQGFTNDWYVDIMRFLILFSTIIPVSLRVNLDLGKSVYAYQIEHDRSIPETVVRTSTIPEDLGRIEYLLTDKTGTLTQNEMELKKLHLGTVSYAGDTMDLVADIVRNDATPRHKLNTRRDLSNRVKDLVTTLAICHNVTPTFEDGELTYQLLSPDEVAIVKFTESVGLSLFKRDRHSLTLIKNGSIDLHYEILQIFPFNSDSKRMGVIVRDKQNDEIWFLQKGADTVMAKIVEQNDWLEEETGNMAREGLRTLVIGRKKLTDNYYSNFAQKYHELSVSMNDRDQQMSKVLSQFLENDLELLGLTGVEDKLQRNVNSSIELLRNAGVKIWMLTGDKVETARCVSVSAKLITRGQYVHTVTKLSRLEGALQLIEFLKVNKDAALLIDGESLGLFLTFYKQEFFEIVVELPTVIACRCSPQQKLDVALLIREATRKRVCCIGDGGNDVSMIQCADVGVGIVGKEGKQASLLADFSITQFCHLTKLLLWHGRNSYKRSSKLAQFVIHRGLIISVCQLVFSISSLFEPILLYQGWLMVGYATVYTMAPVFSLVFDTDVDEKLANLYPELYHELTEGKSLSYKTFFMWVAISLYQGFIIQILSQWFTGLDESLFMRMVAISFTALILNELIMIVLEVNNWTKIMIFAEIITFVFYILSIPFLTDYFDLDFVYTIGFIWRTLFIITISLFPVWLAKSIHRKLNPPNYAKVQQS